ncbi:MAG TPA: hypothetical protein VG389_27505, partial [Myxococcota bacterium]|nr:hypothetical protein [Myxococcota bacterium]
PAGAGAMGPILERVRGRFEAFKAATGIDPVKDVDTLVTGYALGGGAGAPGASYVMVAKGRGFDAEKLLAWAQGVYGAGLVRTDVRGVGTWKLNATSTAAVIDASTVVVGTEDWVKKAIDLAKDGGASAADAEALQAVVKRCDGTAAACVASLVTPEQAAMAKRLPVAGLDAARSFTLSLVLDPAVKLAINLELPSPAESGAVREALAKLIEDNRAFVGAMIPVVGDLLDAVVLEPQSEKLLVSLTLTDTLQKDLRAFLAEGAAAGMFGGAAGAGGVGGVPPPSPSSPPPGMLDAPPATGAPASPASAAPLPASAAPSLVPATGAAAAPASAAP